MLYIQNRKQSVIISSYLFIQDAPCHIIRKKNYIQRDNFVCMRFFSYFESLLHLIKQSCSHLLYKTMVCTTLQHQVPILCALTSNISINTSTMAHTYYLYSMTPSFSQIYSGRWYSLLQSGKQHIIDNCDWCNCQRNIMTPVAVYISLSRFGVEYNLGKSSCFFPINDDN